MKLPDDQQRALDFARAYQQQHGLAPGCRDVQLGLGLVSQDEARHQLEALQRKGLLEAGDDTFARIRIIVDDAMDDVATLNLPLIGKVAAGTPLLVEAHVERRLLLDQALFSPRPDYLLRVEGDSMTGAGILDGDLIAVRQTPVAHNGQIVVARVDDAITVKVFERIGPRIRLLPRNDAHAPIDIDDRLPFAIEGLYCGLVRCH